MAVTQRFSFIVPVVDTMPDDSTALAELTREQAEQLFADLAEALGTAPVGLADDVRALIGMVHSLHRLVEDVSSPRFIVPSGDELLDPSGYVQGASMTPDEALAAMQVSAQAPTPSYERNPGSGIGNGPA